MDNYDNTRRATNPIGTETGGAIDEDSAVAARPQFNLTNSILSLFQPRADRPGVERQTNPGKGAEGVRLVVPGEGVYSLDPTERATESADPSVLLREIRNELRSSNRRRASRVAATTRKYTVGTSPVEIVPMTIDRPAPARIRVMDGGPIFVNAGTQATGDDWPVENDEDFKYSGDEPLYAVVTTGTADVRVWQEVSR